MKWIGMCRKKSLLLIAFTAIILFTSVAILAQELLPFPEVQKNLKQSPQTLQNYRTQEYLEKFRLQISKLEFQKLCDLEQSITQLFEQTKDGGQKDYYLSLLKIIYEEKEARLRKQLR